MASDYRDYPVLYDLQCQAMSVDEDLQYWARQVERFRPTSILEIGCGTGRILRRLMLERDQLDLNYSLTGIDVSDAMLDYGRTKLPPGSLNSQQLSLIHGDIISVDLEGRFDFIVCAANTLQEFHSFEEQRAFLDRVRNLLTTNGVFLLDAQVIPLEVLYEASKPQEQVFHRFTTSFTEDQDLSAVSLMTSEQYDQHSQTLYIRSFFSMVHQQGHVDSVFFRTKQHIYSAAELEALCRSSSLRIAERWSTYDFGEDRRAWHLLWVLERQDPPCE